MLDEQMLIPEMSRCDLACVVTHVLVMAHNKDLEKRLKKREHTGAKCLLCFIVWQVQTSLLKEALSTSHLTNFNQEMYCMDP